MRHFKQPLCLFLSFLFSSALQAQALYPTEGAQSFAPEHPVMQVDKVRWTPLRAVSAKELPASVDNSLADYFPPVIDQKGGSCAQASGIGYMFTYEMNRFLGRKAAENEDYCFSYLFTWNFLNSGRDEGGFVDEGLNIAVKYGVMTAADYGYAMAEQFKWGSGFDKYLKAMRYRGRRIYELPCTNAEELLRIKNYLYDKGDGHKGGGILTFSTQSRGWKMVNSYKGPSATGYRSLMTGLGHDGAHALTIAGYDDLVTYTDQNGKEHHGAFIVVNTWGKAMHDRGRFYLPYDLFLERTPEVTDNILSRHMTAVDVRSHEPKVVYKVELDYSSRDDISLVYGASDNKEQTSFPLDRHTPVIFNNQGGDYPLLGAYNNKGTLEFALDYTEYLPSPDHLHARYFLRVLRSARGDKSGEGRLKAFSILDYRTPGAPREYVCRDLKDEPLKWGDNVFMVCTVPWMRVSANPNRWRDANGQIAPSMTYVLRTASGKYAKLRTVGYDKESGQLTFQYQVQHDGTRKFLAN